mmetsp:Transcript_55281/g.131838  ORF Transcript_55281/g.131838 Transcript_55281/m.131838 type:complete len:202 (-) Transcript_55281:8-613(-)
MKAQRTHSRGCTLIFRHRLAHVGAKSLLELEQEVILRRDYRLGGTPCRTLLIQVSEVLYVALLSAGLLLLIFINNGLVSSRHPICRFLVVELRGWTRTAITTAISIAPRTSLVIRNSSACAFPHTCICCRLATAIAICGSSLWPPSFSCPSTPSAIARRWHLLCTEPSFTTECRMRNETEEETSSLIRGSTSCGVFEPPRT